MLQRVTRSSSLETSSHLTSGSSSPSPSQYAARSLTARSPDAGGAAPGARAEPEGNTSSDSPVEFSDDDRSDFEDTLKKTHKRTRKPFLKLVPATKKVRRDERVGGDLYEAIRQGKVAMQILVDDWLDDYKKNHEPAILELINFLIQACGCKGVVTQQMMDKMQNTDIIRKMTEDFDEDSADYPLSLTTQPWKKFRVNFGEFLATLVSCSQYSIIYDDILMDTVISLLAGLSDSQVRAFRHTSTFAAMKLMTGLVRVAKNLRTHLDTSQRQFNAERAKSPEKRAPERIEALVEKVREIHSHLEEIGNMMNGLFKGVFVHRYRDVHADVRALCIEELGVWITTYPQSFLNDSYLKYMGWTLHDKQGHVRLQCVRSLQELYDTPQWAGKLELFTSRFKDRVLSMVLDKETAVSAEAIKLITLIYKNMENMVSPEDCEIVDPMVYTSNRAIASAAGTFLYQRLLGVQEAKQSPKRSAARRPHVTFYRKLLSFFISSELHEHATYLVDSLWDSAGTPLRDWECQTDLLLKAEAGLDDQEESALIEILVSTIRQAAEGTSPVGRVPARKMQSAKDRKTHAEDKVRLSRHMIITLPPLLSKFSADADKMAALLKVVGYLEREIYCTERLEKHLDLLLAQVSDIVEKHTVAVVLGACSRALYLLSDRGQAFYKKTDITLSNLVDRLTDHFLTHLPDILQVSDLDEDDVYNAAATMKRLSALFSAHDLTRWELFEPCSSILKKAMEAGEIPAQIILPALVCCHLSLLWALSHFTNRQPPEEELAALRKRLRMFCNLCQNFLSDLHCSVREQAFKLLSDLLIVFNGHLIRGDRSYLQPLVYTPDLPLQAELAGFLMDHVFTNSEDANSEDESHQVEALHNRRVMLAGYCKLILYNTLDLHFASEVFKYYVKYNAEYGDIIKETLHKSRAVNKEESTRTILLSLTQMFTGLSLLDVSPDRRFSRPFLEICDLAKRFSLLFGPNQLRNRHDFIFLHKEGIKFSLRASPGGEWSSQNLLFLDVLSEFSYKLLKQDKAALLQYLDDTCRRCIPPQQAYEENEDDMWGPLHAYKKSLSTDSDSANTTPNPASTRRAKDRRKPPAPQVSPRKKRRLGRGEENDDLEDSSTVADDRERRGTPITTSTLQRGRRAAPTRVPPDDQAETDSDFQLSEPVRTSRPIDSSSDSTGTPHTLQGILHRMNLTEKEDEEENLVIDEAESSTSPSVGEEPPDLLDSAIIDSEE
ncbi:cohesin subunit SA-3 isoform X2 [Pseudophryne corroboree]|uniref:cohesin subunit SA-3 isoform X2 n=1 Tax=Pseudophryne corroboree TaxID=495146 RepID=UPI003081C14D